MKQTSTFTLLRVIAAMLCIALLITSGTFSVLATTALAMIPDLSDKNASLHSEPILENLANGTTEVRLPENAEDLLSRLNEYASFTEEEKQSILGILLPNFDKEKTEESAGQAKAAIIQEIEKMPLEAQAEMQIHSYM